MRKTRRLFALMVCAVMLFTMPFGTMGLAVAEITSYEGLDPLNTPVDPDAQLEDLTTASDGDEEEAEETFVAIKVSVSPSIVKAGASFALSASVSGTQGDVAYQWQSSAMGEEEAAKRVSSGAKGDSASATSKEAGSGWSDASGLTGASQSVTAGDGTVNRYWRVKATVTEGDVTTVYYSGRVGVVAEPVVIEEDEKIIDGEGDSDGDIIDDNDDDNNDGNGTDGDAAIGDDDDTSKVDDATKPAQGTNTEDSKTEENKSTENTGVVDPGKSDDDTDVIEQIEEPTVTTQIGISGATTVEQDQSVTLTLEAVSGSLDGHVWSWTVVGGEGTVELVQAMDGLSASAKGLTAGDVLIQCASMAQEGVLAQRTLTVEAPQAEEPQGPQMTLTSDMALLDSFDQRATLTAENVPEGYSVAWSAEPMDIVALMPNGNSCIVTPLEQGEVTIKAMAGGLSASASIEIALPVVNNLMAAISTLDFAIMAEGQTNEDSLELKVGGTKNLADDAGVNAADATFSGFSTSIVSVAADGTLTALRPGTTAVTMTADSEDDTWVWNVTIPGVTLEDAYFVRVGNSITIDLDVDASANVEITSGYHRTEMTWTANGASVTLTGVKQVSPGQINFYVNDVKYGSAMLTIYDFGVEDGYKTVLYPGETTTLVPWSKPSIAPAFSWTADGTHVAVSDNGVVTPLAPGVGTVTLHLLDATFDVQIEVKGVEIAKAPDSLLIGQPYTFHTTDDSRKSSVLWEVTGGAALVQEEDTHTAHSFTITAKQPGTVTVALKSGDGSETYGTPVTFDILTPDINVPTDLFTVGSTMTLTAQNVQTSAAFQVEWSVGDTTIAQLGGRASNGAQVTLQALASGTASVTAKVVYGGVTLWEKTISISVDAAQVSDKTLAVGGTVDLKASGVPVGQENDVVWSIASGPADVISFTPSAGVATTVTALKIGNVTIVAKIGDTEYARCNITVSDIKPTSVQISPTSVTLLYQDDAHRETIDLTATVLPATTTDKRVGWGLYDNSKDIISVDQNGRVTPLKPGTGTVRASTYQANSSGQYPYANTTVTVRQAATHIQLNNGTQTVNLTYNGSGFTISAQAMPTTAYNRTLKYTIIEGDDAIRISGSTVYAQNVQTERTARVRIEVDNTPPSVAVPPVEVSFNVYPQATRLAIQDANGKVITSLGMKADLLETANIRAVVMPTTANQNIVWTSSNPSLVSVTSTGKDGEGFSTAQLKVENASLNYAGNVTIYARTEDNRMSATITVTVAKQMTAIAISGPSPMEVGVNRSISLTATITPDNASIKNLTWTSSNPNIATVSGGYPNATVYGRTAGTVTITAAATDGSGATSSVEVTVKPVATGLTIVDADTNLPITSLSVGHNKGSVAVKAIVTPSDASQEITWTSSNTSIATVQPGVGGACSIVIRGTNGSTSITARTADGTRTAYFYLTVGTQIESIAITGPTEVAMGRSIQLQYTTVPSNPTNRNVTWASSNERIATVGYGGYVTAKAPGKVTITATAADGSGVSASYTITVTPMATRVAIYKVVGGVRDGVAGTAFLEFNSGEKLTLEALVAPYDEGSEFNVSQDVRWTSSNTYVATIQSTGVGNRIEVTGLQRGTTTITATTLDGSSIYGTCTVTVGTQPASVQITGNNVVMGGQSATLSANVLPADTTNKNLVWEVTDENGKDIDYAKITYYGYSQTATLTTTKVDGTRYAYVRARVADTNVESEPFVVSIIPSAASILFQDGKGGNMTSLNLAKGASAMVYGVVMPGAADATMTWTSSNTTVAQVTSVQNGVTTADGENASLVTIYGLAKGSATITARTASGTIISATLTVLVDTSATNIAPVGNTDVSLMPAQTRQLEAMVTPADATDKDIVWSLQNPLDAQYAEVNAITGVVTAKAPQPTGETTGVRARIRSNPTAAPADFKVTVNARPTRITANKTESVRAGEQYTINYTMLSGVTGVNMDEGVKAVSSNANVKVISAGNGTVTVEGKAGMAGKTAVVTITSTANPAIYVKVVVQVTN